MIGKKFGRWTVIDGPFDYVRPAYTHIKYLCRCECGTQRKVFEQALKHGKSLSCGCLQKEVVSERMSGENHPMYKHGHAKANNRTKEWRAWNAMIRRCTYPSMDRYPEYGGRGITVCARWRDSFENFLADVGTAPSPDHSIDRIDNDGNYEPDNVRWANNSQQIRNSRKARMIEYGGRSMTIGDWSEETGINRQTIQMRLDTYGWTIEDTLTTPARKRTKRA